MLCRIDNDGCYDEELPHFILDVRVKLLSSDETASALEFFKHGFPARSMDEDYYMLNIIGSDICIDLLCQEYEFIQIE